MKLAPQSLLPRAGIVWGPFSPGEPIYSVLLSSLWSDSGLFFQELREQPQHLQAAGHQAAGLRDPKRRRPCPLHPPPTTLILSFASGEARVLPGSVPALRRPPLAAPVHHSHPRPARPCSPGIPAPAHHLHMHSGCSSARGRGGAPSQ